MAFTIVAGLALTLVAFAVLRELERERVQNDFEGLAVTQARAMSASVRSYEECLFTLRNLFTASGQVNRDEFHLVCADLRNRWPGIHSLRWLPRVKDANRNTIEAAARSGVHPQWVINDGLPHESSPKKPSERRNQYLPVLYSEPPEQLANDLGLDEFRGPHQRALQRAIETGEVYATRRVVLDESGELGWKALLPLYEDGAPPGNAQQRWDRLLGVVEGVFEFRALATQNASDLNGALDLVLADETPGTTEPYLLNVIKGALRTSPPPFASDFRQPLLMKHSIHSSGRQWMLYARPNADWLATKGTGLPYLVLTFGLWLTAFLAASLYSARSRADTVTHLVDMRTAQLAKVQEQLHEDVQRRRDAEDRYRAFVQQSTEAIWRFELDEPMPVDWPEARQVEYIHHHAIMAECNDVCARSYGFERSKEIIGKHLRELLPLDDPRNLEHLRDFVRGNYRITDSETHEIDATGNTRILVSNVNGVVEDGMLIRAWGTQRDITAQRHMEQERIADAQRLRIAMASANLGLWEWDCTTDSVTWNDELHAMFGLKPGEFAGTYAAFLRFVHPADRDRIAKAIQRSLDEPGEFEYEYRIQRPDGSERWIFTRGDVRRNDRGRVTGMVGATLDITGHKEEEEERTKIEQKLQEAQKLESLGILAGGIAHDFNNLLTGILGNAALARMDLPANSPIQHQLGQIEQASQRAADLCKQMLAYSGKGRFIIQLVNLSHLVEETASLLRVSISKDATLQLNLARNLPPVTADATQLRQILMNLVINASDALGERPGLIQIKTGIMHANRSYLAQTHLAPDLAEGDYVYLEVSDNGVGMTSETRKRIFDPFFTTKFTGRGLGLAAVLGIVRGHQGALKVDSTPMKGTTFRLILPPAEGVPEPSLVLVPGDPEWRGSGRILVVDDEDTVRQVSAQMLRGMGFDPVIANDGQSAIKQFAGAPDAFAGVLLDLTMPRMDGAQTFAALRRLRPEIKVVLMSGYNEREAINRFAGQGLSGFLQKPFTPNELAEVLRTVLEPSGATEASKPVVT